MTYPLTARISSTDATLPFMNISPALSYTLEDSRPDSRSSKVVFPAPEGPMSAHMPPRTSSILPAMPETSFKIRFLMPFTSTYSPRHVNIVDGPSRGCIVDSNRRTASIAPPTTSSVSAFMSTSCSKYRRPASTLTYAQAALTKTKTINTITALVIVSPVQYTGGSKWIGHDPSLSTISYTQLPV